MKDSFSDRMEAQRAILKQINQVRWPQENLLSLSGDAIQRWVSANRLGDGNEIVKLAREAGNALLFLANSSQEQVSTEYQIRSAEMKTIYERLGIPISSIQFILSPDQRIVG
jgi:hypothetical protein